MSNFEDSITSRIEDLEKEIWILTKEVIPYLNGDTQAFTGLFNRVSALESQVSQLLNDREQKILKDQARLKTFPIKIANAIIAIVKRQKIALSARHNFFERPSWRIVRQLELI